MGIPFPVFNRFHLRRCNMKSWVVAVVVLVGLSTTAQAQVERSRDYSDQFQFDMIECVVRIHVRSATGWTQGSGVSIAYRDGTSYILTAEHVIRSAQEMQIDVFTRASYPRPV